MIFLEYTFDKVIGHDIKAPTKERAIEAIANFCFDVFTTTNQRFKEFWIREAASKKPEYYIVKMEPLYFGKEYPINTSIRITTNKEVWAIWAEEAKE